MLINKEKLPILPFKLVIAIIVLRTIKKLLNFIISKFQNRITRTKQWGKVI